MADLPPEGRLPAGADWQIEGQLVEASNIVLRMVDGPPEVRTDATPRAVFKPVRGERPLADFPLDTLAHREVAMWIVAEAGGWTCVPETVWFEHSDLGPGSLQRWVGPLQPVEQELVSLWDTEELTETDVPMHPIAMFETDDGPLVLAHTDDSRLRDIAALDIITANADRKGSHLIETGDALYAIDNGLAFHEQDKLRTVLWGWAGSDLGDEVRTKLERLLDSRAIVAERLSEHLDGPEIEAFNARVDALLASGLFPEPPEDRYGLPWPPV